MFLIALTFSSAGCAAVEGIFKAGVWVGVIVAVIVVASAVALFSRFSERGISERLAITPAGVGSSGGPACDDRRVVAWIASNRDDSPPSASPIM